MQPPDTSAWALNSPKTRLRARGSTANALLIHLEPMSRVWWLQLSFFPAEGANSTPPNYLAGF